MTSLTVTSCYDKANTTYTRWLLFVSVMVLTEIHWTHLELQCQCRDDTCMLDTDTAQYKWDWRGSASETCADKLIYTLYSHMTAAADTMHSWQQHQLTVLTWNQLVFHCCVLTPARSLVHQTTATCMSRCILCLRLHLPHCPSTWSTRSSSVDKDDSRTKKLTADR